MNFIFSLVITLCFVIVIVIIVVVYKYVFKEGFESHPNDQLAEMYTNQIKQNESAFTTIWNGNRSIQPEFVDAKYNMPWLDIVTFESLRQAKAKDEFSLDNIKKIVTMK